MRLRSVAKELTYGAAYMAGLAAAGRRRLDGGMVVLTYHSFGSGEEHPYVNRMPIERFKRQLAHLKKHYCLVTMEDGIRRLECQVGFSDRESVRKPMVAVTVDDGFCDAYYEMFPVVRESGVPVSIYVATDYVDTGRLPWPTWVNALMHFATTGELRWPVRVPLRSSAERQGAGMLLKQHLSRIASAEREAILRELERALAPAPFAAIKPLTWRQIREMQEAGVDFGSHTRFHGWLDCIDPAEVRSELADSKARIETETGVPCRGLAYPNGNWNDTVAKSAAEAGYAYALTQDRGINRRSDASGTRHAFKRIEVPFDERIGTFACRASGTAR